MKINEQKATLEMEGFENKGQKFSIKQSARAFEILSSNIYSDKPLAVVRELGCNARDAHIAAGKDDVPFDVHLPNQFEPWFSIRDYGIGLSHDNIMTLYVTYFDSTKGDSNEMVGALGLGSKSPFSYTDQFTVTSWFDGVKRQYSAYLDEDRCPAITPLDDGVPTDEANGLEVYMAVKPTDFSTFANRAKKVFHRFPTLPKITGSTDTELIQCEYALEGNNYKVRKSAGFNSMDHKGCYAIQGAVAYPVDVAAFALPLSEDLRTLFESCPVDIIFPIGQLNITASREKLNYDKITQQNLIDVGQALLDDLPKKYENVLAAANSMWEAKLLLQKWWDVENNSTYIRQLLDDRMTWRGQKVTRDYIKLKMFVEEPVIDLTTGKQMMSPTYPGSSKMEPVVKEHMFGDVTTFTSRDFRKIAPRGSTYKQTDVPVRGNILILMKDRKPKNFGKFIKHHFEQSQKDIFVIELTDTTMEQEVMDRLGNPPADQIMRTSTMDDPPVAPKVKDANANPTAKVIRKLMYIDRIRDSADFSTTETTTDMNEGGLFVVLYDKKMVVPGNESDPKGHTDFRLPKFLYRMLQLGLLNSEVEGETYRRIFAVNSTFKNSLIKNDKWETAWDHVHPKILAILADPAKVAAIRFLGEYIYLKKHEELFYAFDALSAESPYKANSHFIEARDTLLNMVELVREDFGLETPSIRSMGDYCRRFLDLVEEAKEILKIPPADRGETEEFRDFFVTLDKTYPLLADMARQRGTGQGEFDNAQIMHYINLCDGMPSLVAKASLTPKT